MDDPRDGCREFDERLLDSVFAPVPDAPLDRHLAACGRCRRARDLYLRIADGIASALALEERMTPAALPRGFRSRRAVAATAAAALLLLGAWWILDGRAASGGKRAGETPAGSRDAATSPAAATGTRRYVAAGEEIRISTPGGLLRCRDGIFDVEVRGASASPSGEEAIMSGGRTAAAVVTVSVAAGVVWWATSVGEIVIGPGESAVRPAAAGGVAKPEASGPATRRAASSPEEPVAAHPFREPAPAAPPATAPAALEIEVLGPDGAPEPAALLILFRGDDVLGAATTDARGVARLDPPGGEAEVVAAGSSAPPRRERLPAGTRRHRLRLGPGASVSGTVQVDGAPPSPEFVLTLEAEHPFAAAEGLPPAVRSALASKGASPGRLARRPAADGAFRFTGLSGEFTGRLSFPWGYALAEPAAAERTLPVPFPGDGLAVRLRKLPVFTGRVVTAAGDAPVPRAGVHELMLFGSGAASTRLAAGDDGRFEIVMHRSGVTRLVLEFTDAGGRGNRVLSLEADLDRGRDLGDVALSAVREVPFLVEDLSGVPIAGAVAVAGADFEDRSAPTGADGRGTLPTTDAARVLRAAATGYGAAEAPIPAGGTEPVRIRLAAGNALVIHVRDAEGAVPERVMVSVSSTAPLFPGRHAMDPAHAALARGPMAAAIGLRGGSLDFEPDALGKVVLAGLAPATPFTVRAVDRMGGTLAESTLSLGATESRAIDLRVDAVRRTFRGRAVDDRGRGIAGVLVTFHISENLSFTSMSHDDGRFQVEDVYSDRIRITVTREGYVPVRHDAFPVPTDGSEARIVLEPGRTVSLRVEDASGRPLAGVDVAARVPGFEQATGPSGRMWSGATGAAGSHAFSELPLGRITLEARPGERAYTIDHDVASGDARIVVPVHGSLAVRMAAGRDPKTSWRLRLEPADPALDPVQKVLGPEEAAGRALLRLPYVLPGHYTLRLERRADSGPEFIRVAEGVAVTIEPGTTTETSL